MRNVLSEQLHHRIYLYDKFIRTRYKKKNQLITDASKDVWKVDPITDFADFRDAVLEFKEKTDRFSDWRNIKLIGEESLFYGHIQALFDYAGVNYSDKSRLALPAIEHGVYWNRTSITFDETMPYTHNIVSQGKYRHNNIRKETSIPHYIIGPYIHYADSIYDSQYISKIKSNLGRILLVFPAHTCETSSTAYARTDYVQYVMQTLAKDFDTVLVSCYWNDVQDDFIQAFEAEGAQIISAGMRSDPSFIKRLKAMILMSDCVTGNTLGTHIGYSVYLDRPFYYEDGNNEVSLEVELGHSPIKNIYEKRVNEAKRLFSVNSSMSSDSRKNFFSEFWGGYNEIKTPQEMRAIIEISNDVLESSKGNFENLSNCINDLRAQYKISISQNDRLKSRMLDNALL